LIRIHIIEAENLAEKDKKIFGLGGKSDPFVVVKGTCIFSLFWQIRKICPVFFTSLLRSVVSLVVFNA